MKVQASIFAAALLVLLLGSSGCAVATNEASAPDTMLETVWKAEPPPSKLSGQPGALRLFFSQQRQDLLVVYDEYPLGDNPMRTRAYWLYESEDRLGHDDGHVSFVKTNSAVGLAPVPVCSTTAALSTNSPEALSVVTTVDNDYTFTVYSGQREVSTHTLPLHFVGPGNVTLQKIAVSPLAILVDGMISKLDHMGEP